MTQQIKTEEEKIEEAKNQKQNMPTTLDIDEIINTVKREIDIEDINGTFEIVSVAPTHNPISFSDYIVLYKSGSTYRIYQYIKDSWHKVFDSVEYTDLTDAGATTLHSHATAGFTSKARAYLTTTDQAIATSSETKVTLNTESYDVDGEFDSTTNYRFTATVAGYYQVNATLIWTDTDHAFTQSARIKKNTTIIVYSYNQGIATTAHISNNLSDIVYLAATDYLELFAWHNKGSNSNVMAGADRSFMSIHRLS